MRIGLRKLAIALAIVLGILAGLGIYTFAYAEGFSYFSSDPQTCVNCHIMRDEYDSWSRSSHHAAARCVDCHLPQEFIAGYLAKASNGYHHSIAFTFGNFHEPIRIKPNNAKILQDNCLRCHQDMVHQLVAGATTDPQAVRCVHCHAAVGHGPVR